jgi:hypothetical protein
MMSIVAIRPLPWCYRSRAKECGGDADRCAIGENLVPEARQNMKAGVAATRERLRVRRR